MGSIQKFSTFEEADEASYCFEPDQEYFERVARLWDFVDTLCPRQCPGGIFRYRSIQEANDEAETWLHVDVKRIVESSKS